MIEKIIIGVIVLVALFKFDEYMSAYHMIEMKPLQTEEQ